MKKKLVFALLFFIITPCLFIFSGCNRKNPNTGNVEIQSIVLNKESLSLDVGDSYILTATINPTNATNKILTWYSSNSNIVLVNNGHISAIGVGNAIITAKTTNNITATCYVTVENIIESVSVEVYINNEKVDTLTTDASKEYKIDIPEKPEDITKNPNSEKFFYGWFIDNNFQTPLTSDTIFTSNSKIYGKWIDVYSNDFGYIVNKGEATITSFVNTKNSTVIVIPCYLNSFPVTKIASSVFANQTMLRNVIICNGIETIESNAFLNCNSLETISLPNSLKIIGDSAFVNCALLKNCSFPNSIETIGNNAFKNCNALSSINLPENLANIGLNVFEDCNNLKTLHYEGTFSNFINVGIGKSNIFSLIEKCYINGEELSSSVTIPSDVETIPEYAFYNCKIIKNLIVPNTVQQIGFSAFSGCSELENLTIPFVGQCQLKESSNATIFGFVFGTKDYKNALKITQYYSNNSYINYYIPSKLNNVIVTGGNILYGAFDNCSALTNITIPDNITNIGDYAFRNCSSLTNFILPNSLKNIGTDAFYNCTALDKVYYLGNLKSWCNISFNNESSNPMDFGNHFYLTNENDWIEQTSINIPMEVSTILPYAFYGFNNVTNVVIDENVSSIGINAFANCTMLNSVTTPTIGGDDGNVDLNYAFKGSKSLKIFSITKSLNIVDYAFQYWSSIETIKINNIDGIIGFNAFYECVNLNDFYFGGSINDWCDINFENKFSTPMVYADYFYILNEDCEYQLIDELQVPNCKEIKQYTFYGFDNLNTVTISETVSNIGTEAFSNCPNVNEIIINSKTINFANDVFLDSQLVDVYYNGNVEDWLTHSFTTYKSNPMYCADNCYMKNSGDDYYLVTKLEIPNQVKSVKKFQFYGFKNITSIIVPDSVESIGQAAFGECNSLQSITLPFIGSRFAGLFELNYKDLSIPQSLKEIIVTKETSLGSYAFEGCYNITTLVLPDTLKYINGGALKDCTSLQYLTIPFTGCSNAHAFDVNSEYYHTEHFGYIFGCKVEYRNPSEYWWRPDNNYYSCTFGDSVFGVCYYLIPKSLIQVSISGDKYESFFHSLEEPIGYNFTIKYC